MTPVSADAIAIRDQSLKGPLLWSIALHSVLFGSMIVSTIRLPSRRSVEWIGRRGRGFRQIGGRPPGRAASPPRDGDAPTAWWTKPKGFTNPSPSPSRKRRRPMPLRFLNSPRRSSPITSPAHRRRWKTTRRLRRTRCLTEEAARRPCPIRSSRWERAVRRMRACSLAAREAAGILAVASPGTWMRCSSRVSSNWLQSTVDPVGAFCAAGGGYV